jgi:hypothetical protein
MPQSYLMEFEMTDIELNLKIAAYAGWTNVREWEFSTENRPAYVGNNPHPDCGIFVPDYVGSLDVVVPLMLELKIYPRIDLYSETISYGGCAGYGDKPLAKALCELIVEVNPTPLGCSVFEATF